MPSVRMITHADIVDSLPPLQKFKDFHDLAARVDLLVTALGFEERALAVLNAMADAPRDFVRECIVLTYQTNTPDNECNRTALLAGISRFASHVGEIPADDTEFPGELDRKLRSLLRETRQPVVVLDISACTARVILCVLQACFQYPLDLHILYAEAKKYAPSREAAEAKTDSTPVASLSAGIDDVRTSRVHPGSNRDGLPEAVIAFAPFDPDRAKAVLERADESLLDETGDARNRIVWMVGLPHSPEDAWRADHVRKINEITADDRSIEITTFDYRKTFEALCKLERQHGYHYHFSIAPFGSKLQNLGVALFHHKYPETTIHFVRPKSYQAKEYSLGVKEIWHLPLGKALENINRIDTYALDHPAAKDLGL